MGHQPNRKAKKKDEGKQKLLEVFFCQSLYKNYKF